jgi:hypothetical protein
MMLQRYSLNGPLGASLAAIALALAFLIPALFSMLTAFVGPSSAGNTTPSDVVASFMKDHETVMQTARDRWNGRSVFFRPTAPPSQRPAEQIVIARPQQLLDEPPPKYTGPTPDAVVGNEVWFKPAATDEFPLRIAVGEEKEGIRVLAMTPPYVVRLGHRGREHDVPIFKDTRAKVTGGASTASINLPGLSNLPRLEGPAATIETDVHPADNRRGGA